MSVVKPVELTAGLARGLAVVGRVKMLKSDVVGKAGFGNQCVEFHLVVEEGPSGTLFVEAWRDQARRVTTVVHEDKIVKLTNLTIKSMNEKAQWQCTDLDVYGHVTAGTQLEQVEDDQQYPSYPHTFFPPRLAYACAGEAFGQHRWNLL